MKLLIASLLILILISCRTSYKGRFGIDELGYLDKGSSPEEVKEVLGRKTFNKVELSNNKAIHIYLRPLGKEDQMDVRVYYDFSIFYFVDKNLYYWGQLDDFTTSNDPELENVGIVAAESIFEEID